MSLLLGSSFGKLLVISLSVYVRSPISVLIVSRDILACEPIDKEPLSEQHCVVIVLLKQEVDRVEKRKMITGLHFTVERDFSSDGKSVVERIRREPFVIKACIKGFTPALIRDLLIKQGSEKRPPTFVVIKRSLVLLCSVTVVVIEVTINRD